MTLKNNILLGVATAAPLFLAPEARGQTKADELPAAPEVATPTPTATIAEPEPAREEEEPSRFHLTLGTDVTNAYFFRGIRQEDSGLIVQPYADAALDVIRLENATISAKFGIWNSFHGESTLAATADSFAKNWYEADVYGGIGVAAGKWSFDARYVFYTSPSGAFGTVDEFDFSAAFDDTELLGAWSMKPSATLAVETGSNAADGGRTGTYLQLGVSPGFSFDAGSVKGIGVTFPAQVGLSLSNYYEGTGGENDTFGFASVGAKASIPLNLNESWGAWTLSAGVQAMLLGDAAGSFNAGGDTELIGTFGFSAGF
jgi:hypothetical protein